MCGDEKCFEYTDFSSDKLPESESDRDRLRESENKMIKKRKEFR